MTAPIGRAGLASIPASALPRLAPLRGEAGVTVRVVGDRAWVAWPPGDDRVSARLLAVPGLVWYVERDGHWHPRGNALPAFDVPADGPAVPVADVVGPAPIDPIPPPDRLRGDRVRLGLVRDDRPRPTAGLRCRLADLRAWVDAAPSAEIEAVRGAIAGDRVALVGPTLPPIAGAVRFWGRAVLVPLGWTVSPAWSEPMLRRALGVEVGDLVWVDADATVETTPREVFEPLTRAGVRLALARGAQAQPEGGRP